MRKLENSAHARKIRLARGVRKPVWVSDLCAAAGFLSIPDRVAVHGTTEATLAERATEITRGFAIAIANSCNERATF